MVWKNRLGLGKHRILIEELKEVAVIRRKGEVREIEGEDVGPGGDEVQTFEVVHFGLSGKV